ncbi:DUF4124 domain-containing protein [Massilia sp. TS11]|uniref:DUF4124 domain-containing protein n=1 Tax=Massilia sp. TS11 TaxID=2908003 RepID=UPI001EDB1A76|nr:DUF4124 domain-containing protein [Massilia sp. TS11]MCG2586001.1 DUF4124 domain-containing protein [Massilia sp. TS11]
MKHSLLAALLIASLPAWADGPIYLCIDSAGRKELTDMSKPGCKLLDLPGAIPAPKRADTKTAAKLPPPAQTAASPADFPRVDNLMQKARDTDRRQILDDELRSEEKKLAELKKAFNNGEPERQGDEKNYAKYQARVAEMRDNISRSEKNIEALKREIANVK